MDIKAIANASVVTMIERHVEMITKVKQSFEFVRFAAVKQVMR
jgi:hypothetical protein